MSLFKNKKNEILNYLKNIDKRLSKLEENSNQLKSTNINMTEYEKNIADGIKPEYAHMSRYDRLIAAGFN